MHAYAEIIADQGVSFDLLNPVEKMDKHHFVGFFCKKFLSHASIPKVGRLLNFNGSLTDMALCDVEVVNFSYDGKDLLIQQQPCLINNSGTELLNGLYLDSDQFISPLTNSFDRYKFYPIGSGLALPFLHISDVSSVEVKTKTEMIAYADRQFSSKTDLVKYLASDMSTYARKAIIYKTNNGQHCQLIVSENGCNLFSMHFRVPLISEYNVPKHNNLTIG